MAYETQILADAPIHYWRMGEASGPTLVDEIAGNNITVPAQTIFGQPAIAYESTETCVQAVDATDNDATLATSVTLGSVYTVEMWVRVGPTLTNTKFQALAVDSGVNNDDGIFFRSNQVQVFVGGANVMNTGGVGRISTNDTYHIVVRCDGISSAIYVNGAQWGAQLGVVTFNVNRIFAEEDNSATLDEAAIGHLAIYDKALTDDDIIRHYTANIGTPEETFAQLITADSPTYHWPMDEASGATVADAVGSNNITAGGSFTRNAAAIFPNLGASINVTNAEGTFSNVVDPTGTSYTVEMFIEPTSIGGFRTLFVDENLGGLWLNSGVLQLWASGVVADTGTQIVVNTTYHIVLTVDDGHARIFVNGTQRTTATATATALAFDEIFSENNSFDFVGRMSDVVFYDNVVLTPQRIWQHNLNARQIFTVFGSGAPQAQAASISGAGVVTDPIQTITGAGSLQAQNADIQALLIVEGVTVGDDVIPLVDREQQGDVYLFHTPDGGEIDVEQGVTEMRGSLETSAYLSLFGGNYDDPGEADTTRTWWGNIGEPPANQYRSRFAYLLGSIPAIPANLRRLEDAARRDLAWLISSGAATDIDVSITMPALNRIRVIIDIDGNQTLEFVEVWSADL